MSDTPHAASGTGLPSNVAGALAYLLGPITGVAFLVLERHDRFVRFHAMQSLLAGAAFVVAWIALGIVGAAIAVVPVVGPLLVALLSGALSLGAFVLWVVLLLRAYRGAEWELPVVGTHARRLAAAPVAP